MKINDPQIMFSTWLELAAFRAVKFGQLYVKQSLSYDFKFRLELNMANDDLAKGDFELYPDDDGRILMYENIEEVSSELVRNDRIPAWIDISVFKYSKSFTLLNLICAGRFTNETQELYYFDRGTGCFGVKSPTLSPGYKDGQKFKIGVAEQNFAEGPGLPRRFLKVKT